MNKLILSFLFVLLAVLFIGYYEALDEAEIKTVFFIKKRPTLQMAFENIFADNADDKELSELNTKERQHVIAYCRYRLGIETCLRTQEELEACKRR